MIQVLRLIEVAVDRVVGHSLTRRVGAFGLLMGVVPALVVSIFTGLIIFSLMVDRVNANLSEAGGLAQQQVLFRLSNGEQTLSDIADSTIVRNGLLDTEGRSGYLDPFLHSYVARYPAVELAALTDFQGEPLTLVANTSLPWDPALWATARTAVDRGEAIWKMLEGDTPIAVVAYPVLYPPTSSFEGALVVLIDLRKTVGAALERMPTGLTVEVFDLRGELKLRHGALESQLRASMRFPLVLPHLDGFPGLELVVSMSAWEAYKPLAIFFSLFIALGLISIMVARSISQRLSAQLLGPLRKLDDAVSNVGLDGRVRGGDVPVFGHDEIARLATGFNRMMAAIRSAQEELESKVVERTRRLHTTQSRLNGVLESIRDIIYSVSLDHSRTLYMSPAHREIAELRDVPAERRYTVLCTLVHPDEAGRIEAFRREVQTSGFGEIRYRLRKLDGSALWVQERAYLVFDETGKPSHIDGILTDVTAGVSAELAREAAERSLRIRDRALASCDEGVLIAEVTDDRVERLVYANDAFLSLSGRCREELIDKDWRTIEVDERDAQSLRELRRIIRNRSHGRQRMRLKRKDATSLWVEISVAPVQGTGNGSASHMIGIITNVSELVHGEQRYRKVVDAVREVIYQVDNEGRWTFLNPAWTAITGHKVEETLGASFFDFVHPDDHPFNVECFSELIAGKRDHVRHEVRYLTRNGETRWMQVFGQPVTDDDGDLIGFSGTLADITESRDAAEILRLRDRALQASSNGIVIVDRSQRGNPVIFVNSAFERITGYTAAEITGRNCKLLQGRDTNQSEVEVLREALRQEKPCTVTLRNYRKSGEMFWNELTVSPVRDADTGAVTHYVGVQNDVTARREADLRLLDLFMRLDMVFTLSPDGFVSFDGDDRVAFVNPAFERMSGFSSGEMAGLTRDAFDARMLALSEPSHPYRRPAEQDGQNSKPVNFTLRGTPPRIAQVMSRHCGTDNATEVLYFRDITREAELDRMKSEFLSTAAHELRTPMASIMGFSELLLAREYETDKRRDMLERINRQSKRLTNLLNELLDLARIEARRGKDFDLRTHQVSALVSEAIGALMVPGDGRAVDQCIPSGPIQVVVDQAKIQQALTNVLSNAYKYSPDGGAIRLEVLTEEQEGGWVGLMVSDEGIGMTPEQLRHAFERFFRADTSGSIPGTGLGLSVVKEIIELHGGRVDLRSAYGKGTQITLWLPMAGSAHTTDPTPETVSH